MLRIGGQEIEVAQGDYVALPTGETGAHQILNNSNEVLRYLCFSTMVEPDIMVYPDSGKIGMFAGAAPGSPKAKRTFSKFLRSDAEVGYFDGERKLSALGLPIQLSTITLLKHPLEGPRTILPCAEPPTASFG